MTQVLIEKIENQITVQLLGVIDESTQIFELIEKNLPAKVVRVNCKKIDRINSGGVRTWIRCFKELHSRGVQVIYEECPPQIVEQINMISNFIAGGTIESIYLPYSCQDCKAPLMQLAPVARLKISRELPVLSCPKCGGKVNFDEFPEDYFVFLDRDAASTVGESTKTIVRPPQSSGPVVPPAPKRRA